MAEKNKNNVLSIFRVANGFILEMPDLEDPAEEAMKKMSQSMEPLFDKIGQMGEDADPVLQAIRDQAKRERHQVNEQLQKISLEPLGIDEYTYIFPTWGEVMDFLQKLDLV